MFGPSIRLNLYLSTEDKTAGIPAVELKSDNLEFLKLIRRRMPEFPVTRWMELKPLNKCMSEYVDMQVEE